MVKAGAGWPTTWSAGWNLWFANPENRFAQEPPQYIKDLYSLSEQFMASQSEEESLTLGKKISKIQADNLWTIGTIAMLPHPVIISNRIKNVPEKGMWGYSNIWSWPAHPETYYVEE